MKIYISGRITNNPNYREEFYKASEWLVAQGYQPINPSNLDITFPDLSYEEYMTLDYKLLEMCEGIFMIHGWQSSKGACAELTYAKSLGKKIIYQDYYGRGKK